ncbi:hypothetical protein ACQZV8_14500 [Magnetococcales bacterium HHB-1]
MQQSLTIANSHQARPELTFELQNSAQSNVRLEINTNIKKILNYQTEQNIPGIEWLDPYRCRITFAQLPSHIETLTFILKKTTRQTTTALPTLFIYGKNNYPRLYYQPLDQNQYLIILGELHSHHHQWRFRARGQHFRKNPPEETTIEKEPQRGVGYFIDRTLSQILFVVALIICLETPNLPFMNISSQGIIDLSALDNLFTLIWYLPFLLALSFLFKYKKSIILHIIALTPPFWVTFYLLKYWQKSLAIVQQAEQRFPDNLYGYLSFLAHNQITLEWGGFAFIFSTLFLIYFCHTYNDT